MSILRRLQAYFRNPNADFDTEAETHIALRAAHLESQGQSKSEAHRQARIEFGAKHRYREAARQALGLRILDELRADIRYALRGIKQAPGFAATSITVLAAALSTNILFFTLYDNYVLKPLPIKSPERNYDLTSVTTQGRRNNFWSLEEYEKLKVASQEVFDGLYSESTWQVPLLAPTHTQAFVTGISGPYFDLHATAPPALGQYLRAENRNPEIVLSDVGHRRLFQSDPNIIGRTIRIRQTIFTVIGVAPRGFHGTELLIPDFWASIHWNPVLRANYKDTGSGANVSGILKEGVTPSRAQAILSATALGFPRESDRKLDHLELTLRNTIFPPQEESQIAAALLFAAFLMVLAVACANLANLHLARAAFRTQEIAIRLSLGAGRPRLLRQLLTESIVLSWLGASLALLLAYLGTGALQSYLHTSILPSGLALSPITLSSRIFLATALVGLCAGIAFGLLPALEATKPNLAAATKPQRKRGTLIIAQCAASLVLLILAGILVRNTQRLHGADPGFPLDQIVDTNLEEITPQARNRIANLPNVAAASVVSRIPLSGWSPRTPVQVDNRTEQLAISYTDENYLSLLNLRPIQGRNFTAAETERRANVALISAATARLVWPGQGNVLGKTLQLQESENTTRTIEVIGVVPDIIGGLYFQGLDRSAVYLPLAPHDPEATNLLIRSKAQTSAAIAELRQINSDLQPAPLRQGADLQRLPFLAAAAIAGTLGTIALTLTCIGLFGVISYVVAHKTKEIGIRLALGAEPNRILLGVLTTAAKNVAIGIALALPTAYLLSRLASANMLKIQTLDPTVYLATPALLLAVTLISCYLPAHRASRVDPMLSLRQD